MMYAIAYITGIRSISYFLDNVRFFMYSNVDIGPHQCRPSPSGRGVGACPAVALAKADEGNILNDQNNGRPEMVIAFAACAVSGCIVGILAGIFCGWMIWG